MKKIIAAVLTLALSLSSAAGLMAMAADDVTIQINGEELQIPQGDTKPFIENDRTLVPMRVIFEAFGATVDWDDATKTVTSYDVLSDVKLVLTVGSNVMLKNGEKVELDVPAKIVGDRTVVPLRAVAEGMSADVKWDGDTRTVVISKGEDGKDYGEEGGTTTESGNSVDYKTLDEVNAAIKANGKDVFEVKELSDPIVVEGYNYNAGTNMVEIVGEWAVGASFPLRITIEKPAKEAEDNPDAEFVEEFDTVDEEFGVMYQMKDQKNFKYALNVHNGYSFTVYIEGKDGDEISSEFDPSDVIKSIVIDLDTLYSETK